MADRKIEAMYAAYGRSSHLCKECCHFVRKEYARMYFKCKAYGDSNSEATDWRANWMACGLFGKPLRDFVPMVDRLKHSGRKAPDVPLVGQISIFDKPESEVKTE